MLINLDTQIFNLDGTALHANKKPLTVGTCCVEVLVNPLVGHDGKTEILSGETKVKYAELARRLYGGGEAELSVDEASDLKKRIDRGYPHPLIVDQVWSALDPKA